MTTSTTVASADRRRLRRSSSLAGVGDGVLAVALPLLAAGVSRDPLAVAAVVAAQHLPWALLAAPRPALVGTADQRTVLGLGVTLRATAVVVVGLLGLAGAETIVLLVAAALVAGLGQALADGAEEEVASVVVRADTGVVGTECLGAELRRRGMVGMAVVGLPLGGLVYELAAALPLLIDVGVYALAALAALTLRSPLSGHGHEAPESPGGWVGAVPALAPGTATVTLAATAATVASSAVRGVLVLLAVDDLGLGAPAFGFLLAGMAGAAALGALAAPTVGSVVGLRGGVVVALVVSGAGYAAAGVLAEPGRPLLGVLGLGLGAGAAMVATVLLRGLLYASAGRVGKGDVIAGFHVRVWAGVPLGALAGGVAAQAVGVAEAVTAAGVLMALAALTVPAIASRRGTTGTPTNVAKEIG